MPERFNCREASPLTLLLDTGWVPVGAPTGGLEPFFARSSWAACLASIWEGAPAHSFLARAGFGAAVATAGVFVVPGVTVVVVFVTATVPGAAAGTVAVVVVAVGGWLVAAASAFASAAAGLAPAGESGGAVRMFEAMAWFCVLSMICTRAPTFTASKSVITSRERIRIQP